MESPLIDVAGLAEMEPEQVTLLDVRWRLAGPPGREEFERGHIPGAVYVDLDNELAGRSDPHARGGGGGRHPLPSSADFEAAMRRAGVRADRPVVVYDDWGSNAAARAWWLLRDHAHPDARVLDGGWWAWRSAHPDRVETGPAPDPLPGDFAARPGAMPMVDAASAPAVAVLVDARAPERYRGEVEPMDPVAGHIPGAVNVPSTGNLDAEGRFLPADVLRARYAEVGATAGGDVAAYCGSGITAAQDVLAMEIAGVRAALYPGSWSDWVSDRSRPVASG